MRYRTYLITFMLMAVVLTTAWGDDGSTLDLKKHKRENIFNSLSKMMPTTYLYKSMFHHSGPKPGPDPEPEPTPKADIHLHVVPHSHTDAGWIETIDWYYERKVKGIFDNIVAELYQDSNMTFVWADTNFLHQWYESQGEKVQKKFDKIVKRGQIEFVGGGWVQNDESLSDLKSIINQMNFGLQYLQETFGAKPKVGWQIDPFGYNHFMPSVFQQLGYDYLVLNRIGDSHKEEFKADSSMDFWLESAEMGEDSSKILTHVLPRHYEPENFDSLIDSIPCARDSDEEKKEFVKNFYEKYVEEQEKGFPTKHHLLLMGKDFGFNQQNGELRKIKYMNEVITKYSYEALGVQINANFSLPSAYFDNVKESKKLRKKNLDFLNYDERLVYLHPNEDENLFDYWVGYYATRPHLKKMINQAFNNFRSMEILVTSCKYMKKFDKALEEKYFIIEKYLSYLLHHDAITGTSRKGTIDDYYSKVDKAEALIEEMMDILNQILIGKSSFGSDMEEEGFVTDLHYYFNQAAYERKLVVKIIQKYQNARVFDIDAGKYLEWELLPIKSSESHLYCLLEISGLTLKNLRVEASPEGKKLDHQAQVLDSIPFSDKTRKLENHEYVLNLKKDSLISDIYMKSSGRKLTLDQEFNYYDGTASGIYIFKPQKDKEKFEYRVSSSQVFQGKLVSVVRTASEGHFSQQIVVFHSGDTEIAPLVETTAQSWGYKEVGFSLKTNPSGSKTFYNHDSNEFVKREFEKIEDISESGRNIYPSVHGFAVKDKTSFFGIVNNYPTGCGFTSNTKNDVQCFLMRNTMMDDDKGLPDYLIDTQKVTFKYFIMLEKDIKEYSKRFRTLSDYFNLPVTTNYSDEDRADNAVISEITEDPDTYYESFMKWMFEETEVTPEPEQELYTPIMKPGNATSFTILHNKDLSEDIEILDLFENYKGKLFVRIRNRDLKESLGEKLKAKDQKIDLKDTFVFKLSAEHKYTLNGLKKHKMMPKPEGSFDWYNFLEGNIVQKTLKLIDKGIKYIKGEEFRHQCLKDGKALLKPREIATFKIET